MTVTCRRTLDSTPGARDLTIPSHRVNLPARRSCGIRPVVYARVRPHCSRNDRPGNRCGANEEARRSNARTRCRERRQMNSRHSWVIAAMLLTGCGEQENTKLPSPRSGETAIATAGINSRKTSGLMEAPYTNAQVKAAIEASGGRWNSHSEKVSFSGKQISDADLEYVKWIPSLEKLQVSNTRITDAGLAHITGLVYLEELDVSNTQITDAGLKKLNVFPRLRRLEVSNTQVTDAGLTELNMLPKLRYVSLAGTQITDAAIDMLQDLPALEGLDITDTQITSAGLEHIEEITNLKSLSVSTNQFTEAGIEGLTAALPECRILRN